jgi:hypothetical protein
LVHYNLACYLSLAGQEEASLKSLARALQLAPKLRQSAREEEDFSPLRNHPKFQKLLERRNAGTPDEAEG